MDNERAPEWKPWSREDAASWIAVPGAADDKYSRGVLGVVTGSERYPGAAVLGVEAAIRTGVGMVRYLGGAGTAVLARRPEVVTVDGRVQAWLIGSGMDADALGDLTGRFAEALTSADAVIADAGALELAALMPRTGVLVTPHYRELARMFDSAGVAVDAAEIAASPGDWAVRAAERFGVTVLLKGATSYIADRDGTRLELIRASPWLATAGTGDVLGGIIGAILATNSERLGEQGALARVAATGVLLHSRAAELASAGGPFPALELAEHAQIVVRELLAEHG